MTEAVKRAEEMRQGAIALLLEEKGEIESQLARLGFDGAVTPPRKEKTCKKCGAVGHMAKTCPLVDPNEQ